MQNSDKFSLISLEADYINQWALYRLYLYVGVLVLDYAGDACECRELVAGLRRLRLGDGREQGGLAHWGEPDHGDPGVARLKFVSQLIHPGYINSQTDRLSWCKLFGL